MPGMLASGHLLIVTAISTGPGSTPGPSLYGGVQRISGHSADRSLASCHGLPQNGGVKTEHDWTFPSASSTASPDFAMSSAPPSGAKWTPSCTSSQSPGGHVLTPGHDDQTSYRFPEHAASPGPQSRSGCSTPQ
ncbi:hypothetical protein PYCCODRAFT_1428495 [Trametes coccinea BRFM310]|uniref:Uncharacterized protein n=1 Tax=Trametes coccinea (strain BRFM310) TaxID=1353009 RepID=A0A1Y2IAK2_TRAC3|nr:hypothetical protein PYCCODRAFT_1428495 [Trametes coccinea BRFM310]